MSNSDGKNSNRSLEDLEAEIAKLKKSEAILLNEKELVEQLFESSEAAIARGDRNSVLLRINRSFTRVFGYTSEEAIGKNIDDLIATEDNKEQAISLSKRVHNRKLVDVSYAIRRRKDGRQVFVSISVTPIIVNKQRIGSYAIWQDITKRVKVEMELEKYRDHLEELVEKRTEELAKVQNELIENAHKAGMVEMATGTLHNVGNILNSIRTSTQLMNRVSNALPFVRFKKANALLRENIDRLEEFVSSDARGKKLMNYYLHLEELFDAGQREIQENLGNLKTKVEMIVEIIAAQQSYASTDLVSAELDLPDIVNDALTMQAGTIERYQITVIKDYCQDVRRVRVQRIKLVHIIINLIRNARDAMLDGPPEKRKIEISIRNNDETVLMRVRDSGVGVAPEDTKNIFSYGFTTKESGHGFGLHSCANYMKEMDGKIWVESEGRGEGATFVLQIPAVNQP